jgi:hypothetical protein
MFPAKIYFIEKNDSPFEKGGQVGNQYHRMPFASMG